MKHRKWRIAKTTGPAQKGRRRRLAREVQCFIDGDGFWILCILPYNEAYGNRTFTLDPMVYMESNLSKAIAKTVAGGAGRVKPGEGHAALGWWVDSSEENLIRSAIDWADRTALGLEKEILTGKSSRFKNVRTVLKHMILMDSRDSDEPFESRLALRRRGIKFIMPFLRHVDKNYKSGSDEERHKAFSDIFLFLKRNPYFRMYLPDDIAVMADDLEASGALSRKENPGRRKRVESPESLISRCQELWEVYYDKPTKKNLERVFVHLDEMKKSKSEKVKRERLRCLRVANREPGRQR